MSLPEGYQPRIGDIIVLHATVKYDWEPDDPLGVHLKIDGAHHTTLIVPFENIAGLYARAWKVGEKVRSKGGLNGVVIACHEDVVWIVGDDTHSLLKANDLEPALDEVEPRDVEPDAQFRQRIIDTGAVVDDIQAIAGGTLDALGKHYGLKRIGIPVTEGFISAVTKGLKND